ncbi:hypothetical protein D3C87_2067730 [compost metagenome]
MYEESLGERRSEISMYIHHFENALASQDNREVKKAAEQFRKQLEEWEGWL